jgi:hypothetical protein
MEKIMPQAKTAVPFDGGYVVKRYPGRTHATFERAGAEAARLSEENEGPCFIVLKVVGMVVDKAAGQ